MFRLASVLLLMHIAPSTDTVKADHQSRMSRQSVYEPCKDQEFGTFVKDRYACDKFFYCGPGEVATSVDCPQSMVFNDDKKICDFPSNYFCVAERRDEESQEDTTVAEPITSQAPPPTFSTIKDDRCPDDDPGGVVFLPNSNECHRYYLCYHGFPIPQECIPELHWNSKMQRCDFPETAGCLLSTPAPLVTVPPVVGMHISCPFRGEQVFPHPEKCNYFIYCVNGYATVQQCPFFHHYDVQSKSCMWQTMARCIKSMSENFFLSH